MRRKIIIMMRMMPMINLAFLPLFHPPWLHAVWCNPWPVISITIIIVINIIIFIMILSNFTIVTIVTIFNIIIISTTLRIRSSKSSPFGPRSSRSSLWSTSWSSTWSPSSRSSKVTLRIHGASPSPLAWSSLPHQDPGLFGLSRNPTLSIWL